jgi:Ca-activated chloride channel family protein
MKLRLNLKAVALSLGLIISAGSSITTIAQTPEPQRPSENQDVDVIKVSTTVVTVPVGVMDRNGRFIADLKQDQFHLFEDGVEQRIAFFENAEQPFTIALMLDVSDSTKEKLAQIKSAAAEFINELKENDRVMVMVFDKNITVLCDPTSDRKLVRSAIDRLRAGGGTSLYDAVDLMAARQLKKIRGRKAIVLFTDGVDTTSNLATYESTLRAAEELDALIYSIQYNTYTDVARSQPTSGPAGEMGNQVVTSRGEPLSVAYKRAGIYLQTLSEKSAGRFYYAAGLSYLKGIFSRIAAELREQYSLGYYPSNKSEDKKRREVRVRVNLPNVGLRYRRSYIYLPR